MYAIRFSIWPCRLILLPSRGLEDLVRIEKVSGPTSSPALADRDFEVSGRVLVYRGRNFLLPEAIVPQSSPY